MTDEPIAVLWCAIRDRHRVSKHTGVSVDQLLQWPAPITRGLVAVSKGWHIAETLAETAKYYK